MRLEIGKFIGNPEALIILNNKCLYETVFLLVYWSENHWFIEWLFKDFIETLRTMFEL